MAPPPHRRTPVPALAHPLDHISLGKILQVEDRLIDAAALETRVYRLESGDLDFSLAPHVCADAIRFAITGSTAIMLGSAPC